MRYRLSLALTMLPLLASAADLAREIQKVDPSAPLGTRENPVRASGPSGQHDFLMRLRCPEGDAPAFERRGSMGPGPYGSIVDGYRVTCASGRTSDVVMDMYHRHRETGQIAGFTTLPEHPAKLAEGCPPKVEGAAPGAYVFHRLEVVKPARLPSLVTELEGQDVEGYAFVRFVIGREGSVVPESIDYPRPGVAGELKEMVTKYLLSLRFTPAEHRGGCPVPQKAEIGFNVKKK